MSKKNEDDVIAVFGNVKVRRPDHYNWVVESPARVTYHGDLPSALWHATFYAANRHKKTIEDWLEAFRHQRKELEKSLQAIESKVTQILLAETRAKALKTEAVNTKKLPKSATQERSMTAGKGRRSA
jgi:hypothetical protein